MGRRRRWDEDEHPRWPRGSGDKSGEFRDKNGGDWAERLGDTLPAGRYGSIATGQTAQCPVCGRTVKVVGTQGKLSTHNSGPGVRCGGSGQVVSGAELKAGGVVARRAAKKPKNPEIKAPEPPKVKVGASQAPINDVRAQHRMARWREGASRPGRRDVVLTRRQIEIQQAEQMVQSRRYGMDYNRQDAIRAMRQQMELLGYDPDRMQDRVDYGWNDELDRRLQPYQAALRLDEAYLRALRAGGDTLHFPRADQHWTAEQLDEPMPGALAAAGSRELAQTYDPAHPLDIYGDMLHIEDDTWFTYQALDTLEQKIPPVYHEVVAAYLASRRGRHRAPDRAGIYVSGRKRIPDLDDLGHLRQQRPRGWAKDKTWADPDGAVTGDGEVLAVAWSENVSLWSAQRTYGVTPGNAANVPGNPLADTDVDPSAMDHEFGHLLDFALRGTGGAADPARSPQRVSAERLWRLVHGRVKREAGRYLNPYFKQSGDAGPQELWADAFGLWAMTTGDQATLDGAPHFVLVEDRKSPDGLGRRAVSWRARAFATEYDIPFAVAFEIEDYFDRLLREVQSGKRKPRRK